MEPGELIFDGPGDADVLFLFAHGAGAPMDSSFMDDIAAGLGSRGVRVCRFEFDYMKKRRADGKRRGPDPAARLQDRWREVIAEAQSPAISTLAIGGKSMGGRIASMVADEQKVDRLVCLGYPFHPPGRPEKTRTEHLRDLSVPTLVVQGERDSFGKPDEVASYELSKKIRVEWLPDGDHSFKPRKKSDTTLEENMETAIKLISSFLTGQ